MLALLSLRGERKRAEYVAGRLAATPEHLPPASVIVPVKGFDEGLRENLAALAALDYPDYELIIVAHSASDIPPGVLPVRARIVIANGRDSETSEKIQNLIAATRAIRKRSEVIAFADSDGRPTPGWLRALDEAPLDELRSGRIHRLSLVPPGSSRLLVADARRLGRGRRGHAGRGRQPIRLGRRHGDAQGTLLRGRSARSLGLEELTDDYSLSEAVHAAGFGIAYAPGALTPCVDHTSALPFLEWIRRQMAITRLYVPRLWWPALIAHIFYCGGMAVSIIASVQKGNRLAEWALIAQLSPGMLKGLNRATLAKAALPEYEAWFKRHSWVHAIWVPLGTWVWLAALVSSAFGASVTWRGRRYPLKRSVK